jgi:D-beta-D-heptose 7-phosphate kinase/D-beta-D-heptose 1-phosphate adenosyltransferase
VSELWLVVVGDALLDRDVEGRVERLCPDAPVPVVDETARYFRPGGAGLAASLAATDGHRVTLITALAEDPGGRELAALLAECGVEVVNVGLDGVTPEKVRIRTGVRSLLRLDRGQAPGVVGPVTDAACSVLESASAVLVSDYGHGVTGEKGLRDALARLSPRAPIVWDPHPRGAEPVSGVWLATPNRAEAAGFTPEVDGEGLPAVTARARGLATRWQAAAVAVTLGADGALLVSGDVDPFVAPAPEVAGGDVCGAGDRFASRVAGLLAEGAPPPEAVTGAVLAASSFVAAGGVAGVNVAEHQARDPTKPAGSAERVIARVRARGGAVVATGGCFDLLHAGHVHTLRAARALGDCLIVCLNSDASVRRIKGSDRPLVPEEDRAAVLEALGCVDAVVLFDEDTPEAVLERLRPDVFAKGGDYAVSELPEAKLLARWGGRAVILPYVAGRSTTRLIEEVVSRGAG